MPAGEGVSVGGWDGTVRSPENIRWVPEGLSLWELSTSAQPGRKADEDYAKRSTTPDGSPIDDATYVELILRPWANREEWARARNQERRWRDIRAYGLDDIEAWLEGAPPTQPPPNLGRFTDH